MTELGAFAAAVLDGLDGAGAMADFLEERGDPRAVLLRRRWRRWRKDREVAGRAEEREWAAQATRWGRVKALFRSLVAPPPKRAAGTAAVDATFRRYVARKFAAELPAVPKPKKPRRRRR